MSPSRKQPAEKRPAVAAPQGLVVKFRGTVASLRAAAEALQEAADPAEAAHLARLRAALVEDAERLSRLVDELAAATGRGRRGRRPLAELLAALARQGREKLDLEIEVVLPVAEARVASGQRLVASLLGALVVLRRDFAVSRLSARSRPHGELVVLDLVWTATEPELWRLREDHAAILDGGRPGVPALREVVQATSGEVWLNLDRNASSASLRLLLPSS